MKTICLYVLALTFFIACGQPAEKKLSTQVTDSLAATVHVHPALSPEEFHHYNIYASHFFDSLLKRNFNGEVLVAKNGEVIYEKYAGLKSFSDKNSVVDEHTAFHLASVSKTFTAMAVLKLWEDGKLSIEDDITKYLPGFPYQGITIKMLLSQRSGLHNYVHYVATPRGWNRKTFFSNQDLLQYIIAHKNEVRGTIPGKHFEYCNTNYALLALIIEKASGETYPQYLTKTFFEPLQMNDSYVFDLSKLQTSTISYKTSRKPYPMEYLDVVYGDKNVYSTVRDLLKWDVALRSGQLFKPATLDSAYMPYSFEKPGKRNYGLGWRMLLIPNGKKLVYHNGWWHGNRTAFVRMIDEGATIIALSNNDCTRVYASKKLSNLFGDYRQGNETFEEFDNEHAGMRGEPTPQK
ncbi:MAG TPA: serine hydrolase domain-containing protein [Puia sp.]|nr:serine hydrolase domain-containing protein [Puia sp.]